MKCLESQLQKHTRNLKSLLEQLAIGYSEIRDGKYIKSDTSPTFPNIPLTQIIPTVVERAWQAGTVQALEEFEVAIAEGNT